MKKLSYIFITIISFFVFFIQFESYSSKERSDIINVMDKIQKDSGKSFEVVVIKPDENYENTLKNIISFSDTNDISVMIGYNEKKGSLKIDQNYIHLKDEDFLNYYHTIHNLPFDSCTSYLTTQINDDNSYDQIDFVDPENHETYKQIVQFYPLESYPIKKTPNEINVFFLMENKEEFIQLLKNSPLSNNVCNNDNDCDFESAIFEIPPREIKDTSQESNFKILIVCSLALFLLYICECIKNKKEIMICRMMGFTSIEITNHLYLKQMIESIILYITTQVLFYMLYVRQLRQVTYPFLQLLLKYTGVFIVLFIILYLAMMVYVRMFKDSTNMKRHAHFNYSRKLNLVLKAIMIIMIITPLMTIVYDGVKYMKEGYLLFHRKDDIINKFYLESYDERINKDIKIEDVLKVFDESGAIVNDYSEYQMYVTSLEMNEDMNMSDLKPYIVVNKNYLSKYELKDKNNQSVQINETKDTLFIPEGLNVNPSDYCSDCDVMEIKHNMQFEINDIHNLIFKNIKDPIVKLQNQFGYGTNLYVSDDKEPEIKAKLEKMGIWDAVNIEHTNELYQYRMTEIKNRIISASTILLIYLITISIILYQSIYIYFSDQKNDIALQYIYGYSWLQRHGDLLLDHLFVYIPILFYLYSQNYTLIQILYLFSIMALFECLLSYFMIYWFEKKNIVGALKGGL